MDLAANINSSAQQSSQGHASDPATSSEQEGWTPPCLKLRKALDWPDALPLSRDLGADEVATLIETCEKPPLSSLMGMDEVVKDYKLYIEEGKLKARRRTTKGEVRHHLSCIHEFLI